MHLNLYLDARHDRSLRVVLNTSTHIRITGIFDADDPERRQWSVVGHRIHMNNSEIQYRVDFQSKSWHSGNRYLVCTLLPDKNILWSDGNIWCYTNTNLDSHICRKKKKSLFTKLVNLL
jgi:hypothetical protein